MDREIVGQIGLNVVHTYIYENDAIPIPEVYQCVLTHLMQPACKIFWCRDIGAVDPFGDLQHILPCLEIEHDVVATAAGEVKGVTARAARKDVVTSAAVKDIVARTAAQNVIACATH